MLPRDLLTLAVTLALQGAVWAQTGARAPRRWCGPHTGICRNLSRAKRKRCKHPNQRQMATMLLKIVALFPMSAPYPYELKDHFLRCRLPSRRDGAWSLETFRPGRNIYRWTAQVASLTPPINLYNDRLLIIAISPRGPSLCASPNRFARPSSFIYPGTVPTCHCARQPGNLNGAAPQLCPWLPRHFGGQSFFRRP